MRILIKGGTVVDPASETMERLDVLIDGGVIEKIDKNLREKGGDTTVIDASGLVAAPGLVDLHAHFREPGFEYKETIRTGSLAAVKGGFTSVVVMANTNPVNDNGSITSFIVRTAKMEGACRVFPVGAITKGLKGQELAEIGEMFEAGIVALSDDGRSVTNAGLFRRALEYAKLFPLMVISHCEDDDLATGFVHEGDASLLSGLEATPAIAEEVIVRRDIAIARYVDAPIHLTHISAEQSVEAVRLAREAFKKVTCDTCPHYFTLTDEATLDFDTNTKVNPPLRSPKDREAIREALRNNTIDVIATDHAPHEFTSKDVEYNLATYGISGLETAFALSLSLVHEGVLSLTELLRKMTVNPARLLRLPYGELAAGKPADVIVFDPNREWTVNRDEFVSKGKNTPFHGFRVKGKNLLTIVDGTVVYRDPGF